MGKDKIAVALKSVVTGLVVFGPLLAPKGVDVSTRPLDDGTLRV